MGTFCVNFLWTLFVGTSLWTIVLTLFVDIFCGHFLWTLFWTLFVDTWFIHFVLYTYFENFLRTLVVDNFCGPFLWTFFVDFFFGHFLWTLCMDTFRYYLGTFLVLWGNFYHTVGCYLKFWVLHGTGAIIPIGNEIQCLPYAGFLKGGFFGSVLVLRRKHF